MTKGIVWVYDDEERVAHRYVMRVRGLKVVTKVFEVKSMSNEKFKEEMVELNDRQMSLRKSKDRDFLKFNSLELDKASILLIDFDLAMSFGSSFLTGERVAYLARCFSGCGLIVGYRIVRNSFDLTLKGNLESYADLNVGSSQLDNPGLWGGETRGFRPWYWPELPNYLESFQERVKDLKDHLNDPISDYLGIRDIVRTLPRSVGQFIGRDPVKTTFRDFVTKTGKGLQERDKNATDVMVARIAAARISKWMERLVLPGQDILIDAPHLVSRYPSLLRGTPSDVKTWDKTARFETYEKLGLDHKRIEAFRFKKEFWLSRPAWFWGALSNYQNIKEVSEPWMREATDYVFCEDSSRFHKREECKEFVPESESPYVQRFVRYFKGVDYQPRLRFSI